MNISDLTGRQRLLILKMSLKRHTADVIAEAVDVPETVVRQLCRDAGIALADKEDVECRN